MPPEARASAYQLLAMSRLYWGERVGLAIDVATH